MDRAIEQITQSSKRFERTTYENEQLHKVIIQCVSSFVKPKP